MVVAAAQVYLRARMCVARFRQRQIPVRVGKNGGRRQGHRQHDYRSQDEALTVPTLRAVKSKTRKGGEDEGQANSRQHWHARLGSCPSVLSRRTGDRKSTRL